MFCNQKTMVMFIDISNVLKKSLLCTKNLYRYPRLHGKLRHGRNTSQETTRDIPLWQMENFREVN